VISNTRKLKTW